MIDGEVRPGARMRFTGPYGVFHLRRSERPILMIAGGSGMAPVLSVLRQLRSEGCERPVRFFYGARTQSDLFYVDLIAELGSRLADFAFVPVLSDGSGGRFVHEAVEEFLGATPSFGEPDVYMCGPPPMLEATEAMLVGRRGLDERRIFQDKFTIAAEADPGRAKQPSVVRADSEREFSGFEPLKRRATLYEDVTIDTQPSVHRHLTRGWPVSFEDGRGTWDEGSTALRSSDWYAFRDPGE